MKKTIDNIIYILILTVPMIVYLVVVALTNNVDTKFVIKAYKHEPYDMYTYSLVELDEDTAFLFDSYGNLDFIKGKLDYNNRAGIGSYGATLYENDIIKLNKDFMRLEIENNNFVLNKVDVKEIMKEESYSLGVVFFISLLGVSIVALVISNKMKWQKKHPIVAVFISLFTGTVILAFINVIVNSLLTVFVIATASWGVLMARYYYLEYKNKQETDNKGNDDKLKRLTQEVEDLKKIAGGS